MYNTFEGIKIFAQITDEVSKPQIEMTVLTLEKELHLLRHFSSISKEYYNNIIQKKFKNNLNEEIIITEELIENSLKTSGSKFITNNYFTNPKELFEFIITYILKNNLYKNNHWYEYEYHQRAFFSLSLDENIGTVGIVSLNDLSDDQKEKIVLRKRSDSDYLVKTIKGINPNLTNQMLVTFLKSDSLITLKSVYSGKFSASIPNNDMSKNEYEYSQRFWNKYVFIE